MSSSTHSIPIAPRLPPEIISLIIDHLASKEDWGTLSTASLLSHQYHRHARKLLFATVTLRLRCNPTPISIRDVARRIQGLYDMIQRNPEACRLVKTLVVLDSYPVYDSQWITQQKNLPRLLDLLVAVRSFTFGCEVGYHQWPLFSLELRASLQRLFRLPQLKSLQLCNLGSIPPPVLITSVRYLQLNNITTTPLNPLLAGLDPPPTPLDFEDISLSYINVRTVSLVNTESAWGVILEHCMDLKSIQWRCWEDPQARDGASFPGPMDLGLLPSLKKLSIRMSYGKIGRDLLGLCEMLEAVSRRTQLKILEISILFPLQSAPDHLSDIHFHAFWSRLAISLHRVEYYALRQVTLDLTVHEKLRTWVDGKKHSSITQFRNRIKESLKAMLSISSFHFKFKVHAFHRYDVPRRLTGTDLAVI